MVTGAFRNKNGVPLNRVKQLAPGKTKQQIAEEQFQFAHRRKMIEQDKKQYQAERRRRKKLGRDLLTGQPLMARRVCAGPEAEFNRKYGRRLKKGSTLVTQGQAQMEAANEGIISEPDSKSGQREWEKYRDNESGWKPVELPDDSKEYARGKKYARS